MNVSSMVLYTDPKGNKIEATIEARTSDRNEYHISYNSDLHWGRKVLKKEWVHRSSLQLISTMYEDPVGSVEEMYYETLRDKISKALLHLSKLEKIKDLDETIAELEKKVENLNHPYRVLEKIMVDNNVSVSSLRKAKFYLVGSISNTFSCLEDLVEYYQK